MEKIKEFIIVFGLGGIAYALIEVMFRGHTHWTMLLTGGAVFFILYLIFNYFKKENIIRIGFLGASLITTAEYSVGCVVNLGLDMSVWDYSKKPLNLYGQICPKYFLAWFALSIPVFYIAKNLKNEIRTVL